jgi:hypothetical protein
MTTIDYGRAKKRIAQKAKNVMLLRKNGIGVVLRKGKRGGMQV